MANRGKFTVIQGTDAPADIMLAQLHDYFQGLARHVGSVIGPEYARVAVEKEEFGMKAEIQFPFLSPTYPSDNDEACSFFWVSASAEDAMKLAVTILRTDEDETLAQKVEKTRTSQHGMRDLFDQARGRKTPPRFIEVDEADDAPRAREIKIEALGSVLDITRMVQTYMGREIERAQAVAAALQKLQGLKL